MVEVKLVLALFHCWQSAYTEVGFSLKSKFIKIMLTTKFTLQGFYNDVTWVLLVCKRVTVFFRVCQRGGKRAHLTTKG